MQPRHCNMRRVLFIATLLSASFASQALAQDICFPTPAVLPGLSGPPDWKAPGTVRTELNEPRWAAAPQTGFESDATDGEGLYRILVNSAFTELSVSFQAPTDPNVPSNADQIYFAFTTDGTTATLAKGVRISVPAAGADPIDATGFVNYTYDAGAGTPWTSAVGAPAWLIEPSAWIADSSAAWGINFKVDLAAAGLGVAAPFKMMLAIHKRDETDVTPPFNAVDEFTPDPGLNPLQTGTLFIQNPTLWAPAVAINSGCADGITITGSQMGTRNANPSTINTTNGATNRFFAQPTYPAGMAVFAGMIEGKFHIANWGSIAASNAPWGEIPNGGAVQNGAVPAPNDETLEFDCPTNAGGQTCGMATPAEIHQCMYVELRAAPGQNVPFTRASAYRNMNFQPLSEYSAPAEISVKGLKDWFKNDDPRDVYLYVYARNMAPHGNEPLWLPAERMAATRRFAEAPPQQIRRPKKSIDLRRALAGKPRELPLPNTGIADLDLNVHQALRTVWPTYDVHVYYDSGQIIKIDETETARLVPMYPFTYFFSHDGPLYGFSHALEGTQDVEVKKIRDDVYLLKVPSESSVKISTSATAHEKPKEEQKPPVCKECPPQQLPEKHGICDCAVPGANNHNGLAALLATGLLLGLALRSRLRRARKG